MSKWPILIAAVYVIMISEFPNDAQRELRGSSLG